MSTGYWWNGYSYERTSRDARRGPASGGSGGRDPATWRDLRFTAIAPVTVGVVAAIPPAGVVGGGPRVSASRASGLVGVSAWSWPIAGAPYAWRTVEPVAVRFLRPSPAMALADRVR